MKPGAPMKLGVLILAMGATQAAAFTPDLPGAAFRTGAAQEPAMRMTLPAGPWTISGQESRVIEGAVTRQAWRLGGIGQTTTQIAAPLRAQLISAGYGIVYDCADVACGGFDFRFATPSLGAPAMHVDLGDYRYLLGEAPDGRLAALMVSRVGDSGFVELTEVAPGLEAPTSVAGSTIVASTMSQPLRADLEAALARDGRAVLDDLIFSSGADGLDAGIYGSLVALAEALTADPTLNVALIGHTDSTGSAAANQALSERRAAWVRGRLLDRYGIAADRITARGRGAADPRADNATPEGRIANRRVEVVVQ